jgi:hypothetical protein
MRSKDKKYSRTAGRDGNRPAAVFSLVCLAAVGSSTVYLNRAYLPSPQALRNGHESFVSYGPAIRVTLADAVIPADAWKRIAFQSRGDETRIVNAIQDGGYITGEQNVITAGDNKAGSSCTTDPVLIQTAAAGKSPSQRFVTDIRSVSVTPKIDSRGEIDLSISSLHSCPSNFSYSPGNCRLDRFTAFISLENGETRILRRLQPSSNAPMRISLVTASIMDRPLKPSAFAARPHCLRELRAGQ